MSKRTWIIWTGALVVFTGALLGALTWLYLANQRLEDDLNQVRVQIKTVQTQFDSRVEIVDQKINKKAEQLSVLEESIDPKDKRWSKIKKIRKTIVDTISKNRYRNVPDIIGLTDLASAVLDSSEKYDVPIPLILAVTTRESAFNPNAVSRAGAQGLMQLMPETAKECANDINKPFYNTFKIKDNVELGTWYLWKMLNIFKGDVELAVRAYNTGPSNVRRVQAGELPNYYPETIEYHKLVLQWKKHYENLGL